jgi:hypothetical protein
MIRKVVCTTLMLAAIAAAINSASGQPAGNLDKYYIRDKTTGNVKSYDGTVKVGPAGYQIVNAEGKLVTTFHPSELVKYTPGDLVGVERADVLAQLNLEEKTRKDKEAARVGYIGMVQKAASAPAKTKQYLSFKKAWITTKILDESEDEEWAKTIEPAVKEWDDFLNEYKTGWEIWTAAHTLSRLYAEQNKFKEASSLWRRLSQKDYELPADLKVEAILQLLDAQIRSGSYATVATDADAELKSGKHSPLVKEKLAIYARAGSVGENPAPNTLSDAAKDIRKLIDASHDKGVQAVGFSMIGELYLASKKPHDARWEFMWVDTVFNTDKNEAFKAAVRLKQCFKAEMDDDHEKEYQEKIRRLRQQL